MKFIQKLVALLSLGLFVFLAVHAQPLSTADRKMLIKKEDSLKSVADSMVNALSPATRFRADSNFVKILVRALKTRNSFSYAFDSLQTVSKLYSPDSVFRIFTWQLRKDDYMYIQKGAIQMKTRDGSLKLYPLFDASMFTSKPLDSVRSKNTWIGAIYYRIILKEYNGKKFYTLLGYDDYSISSNRKWMEVLTFNEAGEPQFGGPYISFKEDTAKKKDQLRFNIEYKKEARTTFNYNPEMDMIIYDHLISETEEPEKKNTYIPDGDFEGFKWKDGQWVHVDKVFDFKLEDGKAPVEQPLRDGAGTINEGLLMERSLKNQGTPPAPAPKKKAAAR